MSNIKAISTTTKKNEYCLVGTEHYANIHLIFPMAPWSKNYYYPTLQLGKHPQELCDLAQVTYHRQGSQGFELSLSQTLHKCSFLFSTEVRVSATWDITAPGIFMLWKKHPSWMRVVLSNSKYLQSCHGSCHLPTTTLCVEVGFCFCFWNLLHPHCAQYW